MSEDMTFCSNFECTKTTCKRNQKNIKQYWLDHSFADFRECENFADVMKGAENDDN